MSFTPISVRKAVQKINSSWFLPAVQRPYVWGSRYESEKYICKLFDSIINRYPIGTLIIWNTDKEVPYRKFIEHYSDGQIAEFEDKSLWKREDKCLVYDGQQRLQTLYSCLKSTLNNRVLVFDLLFDGDKNGASEETGFGFFDKNSELAPGYVSLPLLFCQPEDNKVNFRNRIKADISDEIKNNEELFESNFDKLWDAFVKDDMASLAYFPIEKTWSEEKVNEVFQRLNTGGVPLSGADLLFSKIKEKKYDFEEKIQNYSEQIMLLTNGYEYVPNSILQLIHLVVKGNIRIDAKVSEKEISEFITVADEIETPLKDFFNLFIKNEFNINNNSIVYHNVALLPLIFYVYKRSKSGTKYKDIEPDNILRMKQFFIFSQLNGWSTQSIIKDCKELIDENIDFPLDLIKKKVAERKKYVDITVKGIEGYFWFPLKIMMPKRSFSTSKKIVGRYRPEIDHIFPMNLKEHPEDYNVNVLWNLQPVTGTYNGSKSNKHPVEFFSIEENKKILSEYDFLPDSLDDPAWNSHTTFIEYRKGKMINFLKEKYKIEIQQ